MKTTRADERACACAFVGACLMARPCCAPSLLPAGPSAPPWHTQGSSRALCGVLCGRALLCPGLLLLHFLLDRVDVVPLRQCGRSPPRIMRPLPSTIDHLAVPTSTATRSYESSCALVLRRTGLPGLPVQILPRTVRCRHPMPLACFAWTVGRPRPSKWDTGQRVPTSKWECGLRLVEECRKRADPSVEAGLVFVSHAPARDA